MTTTTKRHRIRFELDSDPINWRKEGDCHISTMACWHSRYNLGDDHSFSEPHDMMAQLLDEASITDDEAREIALAIVKSDKYGPGEYRYCLQNASSQQTIHDARRDFVYDQLRSGYHPSEAMDVIERYYYILPLFLYDHSGLTISTGRFSCPWDSGQVGYIYVKRDVADKEIGGDGTPEQNAYRYLESEVKEYDCLLTGDVYGFIHEVSDADFTDEDTDEDDESLWDEVDSCWGFFNSGTDEEMIDLVVWHVGEELREAVKEGWHNRF